MTRADHPGIAVHEIRGNVCYDDHGDSPYWTLRKFVQHIDGGASEVNLEIDGDPWVISVSNQESGLEPRRSDDVEKLYEYRVNAYGPENRKLPLLIQPRLDWSDERQPQSVPNDLGLATNVKIETAVNLEPTDIERLIPRIMREVTRVFGFSWNDEYFTGTPHEYSTITQYERYARVMREFAKKVVKGDGIFHRLYHLLANVKGSKIVYSADNTEIVGYNHQIRLDRPAMRELPDGLRRGMQIKHYHPEYVRKKDETDPLYHVKIGALFKKGWNANQSVPWSDHRELADELEEMIMNTLEWADVPTKCGPAFITDDHFDASEPSSRQIAFYDDPTPAIERQQDSVLVSTLTRLTDRDVDVLDRVARTDGGTDIDELEEDTGWSNSTIYRALRKLDELLENENGNVSFLSQRICERVREHISQLDDVVDATTRIIEDTLKVDPRDLERTGRAWQNWLTRYGAEVVDTNDRDDGEMKIRIREIMSRHKSTSNVFIGEALDYGRIAWSKAGRQQVEFENARVEYATSGGGTESHTVKLLLERLGVD